MVLTGLCLAIPSNASTIILPAVASASARHLGIRLAQHPSTRSFVPYTGRNRSFATSQKQSNEGSASKTEAAKPTRTWGDKMVILGISLRGAAMLPRFAQFAPALRFLGGGPMLVGAVVSAYEVGGWRLLLGAPSAVGAALIGGVLMDKQWEDRVKLEAMKELREGCSPLPDEAIASLHSVQAQQYETNRVRVESEWKGDDLNCPHWKILLYGTRRNITQPWSVTSLQVSRSSELGEVDSLPPQTRTWNRGVGATHWELVWQRQ